MIACVWVRLHGGAARHVGRRQMHLYGEAAVFFYFSLLAHEIERVLHAQKSWYITVTN